MSGTVSLSPDTRWSAASWLFDWVLKTIATKAGDTELAGHLTGLVDENLGWFAVTDIPPDQQRKVRRAIKEDLIEDAQRDFPATMLARPETLRHLEDLVAMISSISDG